MVLTLMQCTHAPHFRMTCDMGSCPAALAIRRTQDLLLAFEGRLEATATLAAATPIHCK